MILSDFLNTLERLSVLEHDPGKRAELAAEHEVVWRTREFAQEQALEDAEAHAVAAGIDRLAQARRPPAARGVDTSALARKIQLHIPEPGPLTAGPRNLIECPFKPDGKTPEKAIVSVKGGDNVNVGIVRDLGHVIDRETAKVGVFITLAEPTGPAIPPGRRPKSAGRLHPQTARPPRQ